jgi:hypothetical protein
VQVAETRVTAAQYADDVESFMPDLSAVSPFVANMQVFGDASGQYLHIGKCSLLPVGDVAPAMLTAPLQAGLRVTPTARSLGVSFASAGLHGIDWQQRMQHVRRRLQRIANIPCLSAFGRAFAVNAYALSTLLYGAQYACAIPAEHATCLVKWSAAVVDAGLGPDDDLRRPPGIPTSCMAAHPRQGGFGLLPLREHMFSRWACEAAQLLVGGDATPWLAIGRALQAHLLRPLGGDGVWSLALCGHAQLFDSHSAVLPLPHPLRALAVGLRALPPLQYVGDEDSLPVGSWCWHAPLWSNPFLVRPQTWLWFGSQRSVLVGLECVAPAGLLNLPALRTVGHAMCLFAKLEHIGRLPGGLAVQRQAYQREVWGPLLNDYPAYADRQLAVAHVRQLLSWIPVSWLTAAGDVYNAALSAGSPPPVCTAAAVQQARQHFSTHLGWRLGSQAVLLTELSVAVATRLQTLDAHVAIRQRHALYVQHVRQLDALPATAPLPVVTGVLDRWWSVKVANTYKEAAWKLALDAFPTAARMSLATSCCAACGVQCPSVSHHFWACPVAVAVRTALESQLIACGVVPVGFHLSATNMWLGRKPLDSPRLHRLVWDMVCLAAIHAMDRGRCTAWATAPSLTTPVLVEQVAGRAAVAAFWSALADFAATVVVPRRQRTFLLTQQPFLAWHVVLVQGSGLCVMRR